MSLPFRRIVVSVVGLLTVAVCAEDWPHWRGPQHDGISAEKGLETKWDKTPPKLWEREIGAAFSGLTCVAGKLYTCGTVNKKQVAFCLQADSGEVLWQAAFEDEYRDRQGGDGTRATPTFGDGKIYLQGALGKVLCLDAGTGQEVWSRPFEAPPQWGYSASVLVEGDLAIVQAGAKDGALVAVDKQTGKDVWKCGEGVVGYATPYPFTFEGTRYVVGFLGKEAVIAEVKTGRKVWSLPWKTDWDVNAATPIFDGGQLLLSSGYKHGAMLLMLEKGGDGLATKEVWQQKTIRAKFQTPVLWEGYLYTCDEVGLNCVELKTGAEQWKQRDDAIGTNGTIVIAEGNVFFLTEKGELQIAPASPKGFQPTAKVALLNGRCWTVPTLYDGRIYVRNLEKVACYSLKAAK